MKYFLLLVLLLLTGQVQAQKTFSWSRIADYPAAHWGMNAATLDGKLYSFGACGAGSNVLYRYTTATNSWDSISSFSGGSVCFTGFAGVNGKLYLSHNAGIYTYDIATNQWAATPISYPPGFDKLGTYEIVDGTDIYYIAGNNSKNLFRLNTNTQTFTKLASLNAGRDLVQATLMNGKIYVFAGRRSGQALTNAEVYDVATDTWQDLSVTVANRYFGHAVNDGTYIYIMGGETAGGSKKYKSIEMYDPTANTVTTLDTAINDMDHEHTAFAFGQIGDTLIVAGGYSNTPSLDFVTKYSEATLFSTTSIKMQELNAQTKFTVFPNPAGNNVHVQLVNPKQVRQVEIRSISGALLLSINTHGQKELEINCRELMAGNYVINVVGTNAAQSQLIQIVK